MIADGCQEIPIRVHSPDRKEYGPGRRIYFRKQSRMSQTERSAAVGRQPRPTPLLQLPPKQMEARATHQSKRSDLTPKSRDKNSPHAQAEPRYSTHHHATLPPP